MDFRCIADKCPATCCSGWSVIWTDKEISRLKESCTDELLQRCMRAFPIIDRYTAVAMDRDDLCPFLSDGLCEIHRTLGKEYLSYTCREYPSMTRLTGNVFTKSCKTTCYAVVDTLLKDSDSMMLTTEKAAEKNISAMLTPEEYIGSRSIISTFEKLLWDDSLTVEKALMRCAELAGVQDKGESAELNDVFGNIFGWRLILSDNRSDTVYSEDICKEALRNIIKSLFMEWSITGWSDEVSVKENLCGFIFSAAVMKQVFIAAIRMASSRDELICTVSDIAGALYSDNSIPVRISRYLLENSLINMDFIYYILK